MRRLLPTALLLAACAGGSSSAGEAPTAQSTDAAAASSAATEPCNVPVPANSAGWKLVQGTGWTMCVPADWRVSTNRATYSGGTVRWQNGQARLPVTVTSVRVVGGSGATSTGSSGTSIANAGGTRAGTTMGRRQSLSEMIGGQMATIWSEEGNGRVGTGVSFREPQLSMTGEASGQRNVELQLAVYRTIRFQR